MSWNNFEFIVHSMTAKGPGPEAVNSVKPRCSFHHSSQLGWGFVVCVQCQKKALSIVAKISTFVSTHNIFTKMFIQVGKHDTYLSILFFYGSGFIHIVLSGTPASFNCSSPSASNKGGSKVVFFLFFFDGCLRFIYSDAINFIAEVFVVSILSMHHNTVFTQWLTS